MKESGKKDMIMKMDGDKFIDYLSQYDVEDNNEGHEPGVNFHTHHQLQPRVFSWEKSEGVYHDPESTFKDLDSHHAKEVDLGPVVHVKGMPYPNVNKNSSTYGESHKGTGHGGT